MAVLPLVGAVWAALAGFFIATVLNCILSHYFAFRSVRSFGEEFVLVIAMSGLVFAANFLLFYVLYAFAAVPALHAKVFGTCFGFAFNYTVRQFFIFSRIPRFAPISAFLGEKPRTHGQKGEAAVPPSRLVR